MESRHQNAKRVRFTLRHLIGSIGSISGTSGLQKPPYAFQTHYSSWYWLSEFLNEAFAPTQVIVNGNGAISISKNGGMCHPGDLVSNESFFFPCCLLGRCLRLLSAADSSVVGSKVNSATFAIVAADRDFVKEDLRAV